MDLILPHANATPAPDAAAPFFNPATHYYGYGCYMNGQLGTHSNGLNYDCWGYLPKQAEQTKITQSSWSELSSYGAMAFNQPRLVTDYICGQSNDLLSAWGTTEVASLKPYTGVTVAWDTDRWQEMGPGAYPRAMGKDWDWGNLTVFPGHNKNQFGDVLSVCTAANYPNCDMSDMLRSGGAYRPWQNWWYRYKDDKGVQHAAPPTPVVYYAQDLYKAAVDDAAHKMASGAFDYLDVINSCDTSAFDPCADASFLGRLIPPILGGLLAIFTNYALDVVVPFDVPRIAKSAWNLGAFFTGYYYGQAALLFFGDKQENLDMAAIAVAVSLPMGGLSLIVGGAGYPAAMQLAGAAIGGVFGYYFLQEPAAKVLNTLGTPLSFALWLVNKIWEAIAYVWCRLFNWELVSCNNVSGDMSKGCDGKSFADARRWDTSSIAYKLTKMACESEGWSIDSPQAEFVFRGIMTGPQMMLAATPTDKYPGMYQSQDPVVDLPMGGFLGFNGTHINPLGSISQTVSVCENPGANFDRLQYPKISTATGTFNNGWSRNWHLFGIGMDPSHENRFACQNWDVMWGGREAEKPDPENKTLQDNLYRWLYGGASPIAGLPDEPGLIAQAYSAFNIMQQNFIPGMTGQRVKLLSCKEFLDTCMNDSSGVEGFNKVQNRGLYAQRWLAMPNNKCADGVELAKMRANALFAHADISAAWDAALADSWSDHNLTALAWYWTDPKALDQADDFYAWAKRVPTDQLDRMTGDARVNAHLERERVEFYGVPNEAPNLPKPTPLLDAAPASTFRELYYEITWALQGQKRMTQQLADKLTVIFNNYMYTGMVLQPADFDDGFYLWALQGCAVLFNGGGTAPYFQHITTFTIGNPLYSPNPAAKAAYCGMLSTLRKGRLELVWERLDPATRETLWNQYALQYCQ